MIALRNVGLQRGAKILLDGADLQLPPGTRAGVVGPNGCGKSSFFSLLSLELHAERGDVEVPAGWTIAQVAQDTPAVERSALDYVLDGDRELRAIEAALHETERSDDGERLALLHERYQHADGYTAGARASALLSGLGFASGSHTDLVTTFSGGWRMRLNLAQALMCPSDLLLLDEPTNHLDLDAVIWLEDWLRDYAGTLLVISHDREFLDAVARSIVHFDQKRLRLYSGNYSAFERQRAAILAQQQSLYVRQQREIARLHSFIDRFRAKATKARQAQSRMKALAKMEEIAPAHVDSPFSFHFRDFPGSPDPALQLEEASVGYGERTILSDVKLSITAGARIGLLGVNGAGKTTLVKLLAGLLPTRSGVRREGKNLRIGYFAQHQLEALREDESPLQHLARLDRRTREQELRDFLGSFNFSGDNAMQPAGTMSGGEQARLALALMIWERPNLLLLDEPTNHLDLDMREALTLALQEFEGAMVLVSHDRHLLRTATDELMVVSDGRVAAFDGDLDEYRAWLSRERTPHAAKLEVAPPARDRRDRDQRRVEAEVRQQSARERKPLLERSQRLEKQIDRLGAERGRLNELLLSSELYAEAAKDRLREVSFEAARIGAEIERLEEEWLALQTQLEGLSA